MRLRSLLLACTTAALLTAPAAAASASPPAGCRDATVPLSVEEARLDRTVGTDPTGVGRRLIRLGGLDAQVDLFARSLCAAGDRTAARLAVDAQGRLLWEAAVARARRDTDDRPLYWARLAMSAALRQFTPRFALSAADRADLRRRLEYASRGITSSGFLPVPGVKKVFVSGFDPFLLDSEIRRGNPAGASVLRLDGQWITVDGVRAQIQAAVFPVRYADFDQGMVEAAFTAHLAPGPQRADLVTTVSQGRPNQFDLELANGRRRDVSSIGDNDNIWGGGSYTAPVVFPGVGPGPEFSPTTLPVAAMRAAATNSPYLVRINSSVTEIPAGATAPVFRPDGPTAGSVAVEGGGGGYLSNEIAYRDTRLRDALGAPVAAGHVHTPVLDLAAGNATELTDPTFEANRAAITTQYELILRAAISASP